MKLCVLRRLCEGKVYGNSKVMNAPGCQAGVGGLGKWFLLGKRTLGCGLDLLKSQLFLDLLVVLSVTFVE